MWQNTDWFVSNSLFSPTASGLVAVCIIDNWLQALKEHEII